MKDERFLKSPILTQYTPAAAKWILIEGCDFLLKPPILRNQI